MLSVPLCDVNLCEVYFYVKYFMWSEFIWSDIMSNITDPIYNAPYCMCCVCLFKLEKQIKKTINEKKFGFDKSVCEANSLFYVNEIKI